MLRMSRVSLNPSGVNCHRLGKPHKKCAARGCTLWKYPRQVFWEINDSHGFQTSVLGPSRHPEISPPQCSPLPASFHMSCCYNDRSIETETIHGCTFICFNYMKVIVVSGRVVMNVIIKTDNSCI